MLNRIPGRNHITPVLRELHWLKIHDIIILKILLLTHKAVNNTAPAYLCDFINNNNNKYGLYTTYLILNQGCSQKCNNNENIHVDNNKSVHHQEIL